MPPGSNLVRAKIPDLEFLVSSHVEDSSRQQRGVDCQILLGFATQTK